MSQDEITISNDDKVRYRNKLQEIGDGKVGKEIFRLIKSRYKILYVVSPEENRVIDAFRLISMSEGYDLKQWDCSRGMLDSHSFEKVASDNNEIHETPEAALDYIINQAKSDNEKLRQKKPRAAGGHIFMLLDFHPFLDGMPVIERKFKEFSNISSVCTIVIISPVFACPPTLEKEFTLLDFPFPSKQEIKRAFDHVCAEIPAKFPKALEAAQKHEEELLRAAAGLTVVEAENAYAKSLVKHKTFDIPTILDEKKQIIRKGGIIEYRESRFSFDDIGGLGNLKEWLAMRRLAFREDAFDFGLDAPKGVLLVGVPGTGKSMTCDALADLYQMPLLRLDMGAIFSAHVGESEQNMRNVIKTAEAIAPAILWIDEIEKGIGGVQSSNYTDGGVTNRVFGTMLTWLQEKRTPVFVVCTANNVLGIPPEFMRAGRFDEIFFLDLPNEDQRKEILECLLLRKSRNPEEFDLPKIIEHSPNYSPAELEKAINNALFVAYSEEKRHLRTTDVVSEIGKFQPLYNSRREEIEEMRQWALGEEGKGGRARLANSESKKSYKTHDVGRQLDLTEDDL
jgi:ATP-dependent 26S proteasome regulatory subunit